MKCESFLAPSNHPNGLLKEGDCDVHALICEHSSIVNLSDGHLFKLEQIIEGGQNLLVSKYGIQTDRIKTLFGGYRELTTIELWVVPPGATEPLPTPGYEKADTGQEALEEVKK